jgi:hypothetical protein
VNTSIYLLESDSLKREQLKKYLTPLKCEIREGESLLVAAKELFVLPSRLVITALEFEQAESGLDLLLWLRQFAPRTTVILLTEEKPLELSNLVQWNGGYLLDYADMRQIHALIVRVLSYQNELRFSLNGINLFELVQMICLSQARMDIYLNEINRGDEGMICFQQGRIKHAVLGNYNGENALFQIMQMQKGVFGEAENVPEACYTIESETSALLARSALQQDQSQTAPLSVLIVDTGLELENLLQCNYADRLELLTIDPDRVMGCLAVQSYDLTILNLDAFSEKTDLFKTVYRHLNIKTCLLVGSADIIELFESFLKGQTESFFLFPLQSQEMLAWIHHRLFDANFEGELINLQFFDCLQILALSNQVRQIECYDAFLGEGGYMWLANGHVLHVTFGHLEGPAALANWIRLKVGHVFVYESKIPEQMTINQPVARLLMSMAVTLDQASLLPDKLILSNGRELYPSPHSFDIHLSGC